MDVPPFLKCTFAVKIRVHHQCFPVYPSLIQSPARMQNLALTGLWLCQVGFSTNWISLKIRLVRQELALSKLNMREREYSVKK